jgi:hypothetical protein
MNEVVFDASAILALIQQEPGAERLTDEILVRAVASTVNLAEVQCKLVKKGIPPDEAWRNTLSYHRRGTLHERAGQNCVQPDCRNGESRVVIGRPVLSGPGHRAQRARLHY